MKKYILITISLIALSCSNKKETNEVTANPEQLENYCNCSELTLPPDYVDEQPLSTKHKDILKDGKPFTGTCLDKDSNDSIIKRLDFKNGWVVKRIIHSKMSSKYVTVLDMSYDNLAPSNGYVVKVADGGNGISYSSEVIVYKDGKRDEGLSYEVFFDSSYKVLVNERENEDGDSVWDTVDGLRLVISKNIKGKLGDCLKLLKDTNNMNSDEEYYIEATNKEQAKQVLDCLKGCLEYFNYNIE